MNELFFRGIGALGLLLVTAGILLHGNPKQNWLFTLGGIGLLAYSTYLKDPVFIPLQIVFTAASLYEIYKLKKKAL